MNESQTKICNTEVFEGIFRKYAKDLKWFIYSKTNDVDEAEDILQETFIKLWDHCAKVEYDTVKGFLYTTANNLFLNKLKHKKVVQKHQSLGVVDSTNESPEFLMIEHEFMNKVKAAIASLGEKEREVFLLNRIEKKKYKEIAEMLAISVKAVEKRMHKALLVMREKIGNV